MAVRTQDDVLQLAIGLLANRYLFRVEVYDDEIPGWVIELSYVDADRPALSCYRNESLTEWVDDVILSAALAVPLDESADEEEHVQCLRDIARKWHDGVTLTSDGVAYLAQWADDEGIEPEEG